MTTNYIQIQALGNLLSTYRSDLTYIQNFHRYKNKQLSFDDYVIKSPGSFKTFINNFRVARNVYKTQTPTLLSFTDEWINLNNVNNVDDFANELKDRGISHGVVTSLASKILFLNNPWIILPFDKQAKSAVGLKENNYSLYLPLTDEFAMKNKIVIEDLLKPAQDYLRIIETEFKSEIGNLEIIRQNRFVDKLLWTMGANSQKISPTLLE